MPHVALPGPPNLQHDHLRSALEFAVRSAEAWQRSKPPQPVPPEIKEYFKQSRVPAPLLGRVRRIVEADEDFRLRVAAAADVQQVDEIGIEWLRRESGWEQRVADLVQAGEQERLERDAERALAQERRRREAAELKADRAQAELLSVKERLSARENELTAYRRQQAAASSDVEHLRRSAADLNRAVRHANDRVEAARRGLEQMTSARNAALQRAEAAERQRDELLAARAQLPAESDGTARIARLRDLAAAAQALAGELGTMVAAGPRRRQPVDVPRPAAKDPRRAAEFLFRVAGIVVLVDGYNVAMLGWPDLPLEGQRRRLLDAVDGLARRFGTEFVVVLDGADIVGAHADRRRLARVRYSPAGVTADDVIREEVAGLDPARNVVVVTNDGEVRRDVIAAGANVVNSEVFVDLALR